MYEAKRRDTKYGGFSTTANVRDRYILRTTDFYNSNQIRSAEKLTSPTVTANKRDRPIASPATLTVNHFVSTILFDNTAYSYV